MPAFTPAKKQDRRGSRTAFIRWGCPNTQLQARSEPAPQQLLSLQVPALAQAEQQTASFFGLTSCRVAAEDAKPRSYSLQKTHHTPPL